MTRFINLLFQNGRNYNIQIILILHHLNRGNTSTQMIKEADALVIFPDSFDYNTLNTLVHHYGFSRQKAIKKDTTRFTNGSEFQKLQCNCVKK